MADKNEQFENQTSSGMVSTPGRGRRRLLQGGLAAAPLVMTLVSRPVLGQVQCYSCSGHMSMPTSANAKVSYCSGHSPEWWAVEQNFDKWPKSINPIEKTFSAGPHVKVAEPTLFSACFSPAYGVGFGNLTGLTFLQVLQSPAGAPRYFAAALLNVKKELVPVLTEDSLKVMWYEYATTGCYEPTAGVKWYDGELIEYFLSTNA